MARSLRRELLAWLLLPLTAVVSFNVWTTYQNAAATADLITDRTLLASARAIAERIRVTDGSIEAPIPPSALEMFASDAPDRVIYRVTTPGGVLIAGAPDAAEPPRKPVGLSPVYFMSRFRGEIVRAVAIAQPLVASTPAGSALVSVGQTLRNHDELVTSLWLKALRDQVLLVAAAGALALFGLRRGLEPLISLRRQVLERQPADFEPLRPESLQSELRPLVDALNEALGRVRQQLGAQRRFVVNAAHQLRTPLSLLKTQAAVGLRSDEPSGKQEALRAIDHTADGMSRLANQLLALARAEQGSALLSKQLTDFAAIVREAAASLAGQALERKIDLGLEDSGAACPVIGHAALLRELVLNLVDNALRYTPAGGTVTVSVGGQGDLVTLQVEDTGPGIAEAERERVFERFYRTLSHSAEGTGLGLAIVKEIVAAHDGRIDLADRGPPPGLVFRVTLPAARAA